MLGTKITTIKQPLSMSGKITIWFFRVMMRCSLGMAPSMIVMKSAPYEKWKKCVDILRRHWEQGVFILINKNTIP